MADKQLGRPTKYTRAISDEICLRLASGETLNQICRSEKMPARPTVIRWVLEDRDGFSDRYAEARDLMLEHWADEVVEIADDGTNDWVEREGRNGGTFEAVDHEHVNRSRLRVDTRRWLLSKLKPERYGERLEVNQNVRKAAVSDEPEDTVAVKASWQKEYGTKQTIQ